MFVCLRIIGCAELFNSHQYRLEPFIGDHTLAKNGHPVVHHIPITKARTNLGALVRRVHLNKECFILEKGGIPVAGIIDMDEMEDHLELRNPKLKKQIQEAYAAYRRGDARDADTFLGELRREASGRKKK